MIYSLMKSNCLGRVWEIIFKNIFNFVPSVSAIMNKWLPYEQPTRHLWDSEGTVNCKHRQCLLDPTELLTRTPAGID